MRAMLVLAVLVYAPPMARAESPAEVARHRRELYDTMTRRCRLYADRQVAVFADRRTKEQSDAQWGRYNQVCSHLENEALDKVVGILLTIPERGPAADAAAACFAPIKDERVNMPFTETARCLANFEQAPRR